MFYSFCTAQNRLYPTPTYVRGKIAPRSTSSSHSKAPATRSIYGSPYGRRCN